MAASIREQMEALMPAEGREDISPGIRNLLLKVCQTDIKEEIELLASLRANSADRWDGGAVAIESAEYVPAKLKRTGEWEWI